MQANFRKTTRLYRLFHCSDSIVICDCLTCEGELSSEQERKSGVCDKCLEMLIVAKDGSC